MASAKRKPKPKAKSKTPFDRPIMIHVCKDGTVTYRKRGEPVFNGVALPVFSVETVEEAKQLQVRFCRLMYGRHPDPRGPENWYRLNQGEVELDDLDRVMADFATFYAEHISKTKADDERLARKLRTMLVEKLQRRSAGVE